MKIKDEFIIKKLVFAKYLFQKAITELSIGTDLAASVSINLLHDSIEMVIISLEDFYNLTDKKYVFKSRVKQIKESMKPLKFPFEKQMLAINNARRNFKHEGQLQNFTTVKELSNYALQFINQAADEILKVNFDDISLSALINDKEIKKHLKNAEIKLIEKNYKESITSSAKAFELGLIHLKNELDRTFFLKYSNEWGWSNSDLESALDRDLANKIKNSFEELYSLTTFSIFGIDLQKYAKFKLVTPDVGVSTAGKIFINYSGQFENEENKTFDNAQFCIDFALDFNLKVQNNWLQTLRMNYELSVEK